MLRPIDCRQIGREEVEASMAETTFHHQKLVQLCGLAERIERLGRMGTDRQITFWHPIPIHQSE